MNTTTLRLLRTSKPVVFLAILLLLVILGGSVDRTETSPIRRATSTETDLLVTVRGVGICSGAPIENTRMVVTAAHCLLDPRTGSISTRHDLRVERDGIRYDIEAIIIDPASTIDDVVPARDAAVLLLRTEVHGKGVSLSRGEPVNAQRGTHRARYGVVLIGHQPVGINGKFHRGRAYDEPAKLLGASPGATYIGHTPAACDAADSSLRDGFHVYLCGMVPGGSGGPVVRRGSNTLIGIISSVNRRLTWNGVTPVEEIHRLIDREENFTILLRELPDSATGTGGRARR